LPTVDCGPAPIAGKTLSGALVSEGATVPIIIRSPFELGRELSIQALIDTGSEPTLVNESLIRDWQLTIVDYDLLGVPDAQILTPLFLVELEIPALGIREFITVASKALHDRAALLGRAQMRDCVLVYDGPHGTAQLRR